MIISVRSKLKTIKETNLNDLIFLPKIKSFLLGAPNRDSNEGTSSVPRLLYTSQSSYKFS